MNYGYIGNLKKQSKIICDCLSYGQFNTAHLMIYETACAETGAGNIKDTTLQAGMGLTQFDIGSFYFIRKKSKRFRKKIKDELGVDIDKVEWGDLRYNSFLSLLFTRLFYLNIKENIPKELKDRAKYWKKYFNTYEGKGTVEHYIQMVATYYT